MTLFKFLERLVIHHPKKILVSTVLLGMLAVPSLLYIQNDPSPHLLPISHPVRQAMEQLREDYTGTNPGVFIMLEAEDTIFKTSTLERIKSLTEAIENLRLLTQEDLTALQQLSTKLPGESAEQLRKILPNEIDGLDDMFWMEFAEIRESLEEDSLWLPAWDALINNLEVRSAPVVEVLSMANTDDIVGTLEGLDISPLYEETPETPAEINRLRNQVLANELFRNYLYSEDGRHTGIFVELATDEDDSENLYAIYQALERVFEENPGEDLHYIAGFPIIAATLRTVIDRDTKKFFPFVALLAVFFLWLTFRKFIGVAVPMLVVGFSILFTLAIMVIFEVPLNSITSALPVFLISIGVADGIHMFSEYRDNRLEGHPREKAVSLMLEKLALPVTMTSITTAVGFFSLTVSDIIPILTFGIFVAIGTLLAMVLSLVFIPALLMVLPEKETESAVDSATTTATSSGVHQENFMDRLFQKFLEGLTSWVLRNAKIILLGALIISGFSFYGLLQLKVESNLESYFKADAPFVVANKAMEKMSGSRTINIVIKINEEGEPWKNPENLKLVEDFQKFLSAEQRVKRTFSLVDLIKRISYAFNENRTDFNRLPQAVEILESEETFEENGQTVKRNVKREVSGRDLVAQYLVLYENSGGDVLSDVIDSEYRNLNLSVNISSNSTTEEEKLLKRIDDYAAQHFPPQFSMTSTGMVPINVATSTEVVSSQILSLSGSLLAVLLMLVLIFRSFYRGVMGMIPLVFTVLFNFGFMGYFGVNLDIGTALVSSIVIGIGVDYSIHYLSRMFSEIAQGATLQDAIARTVRRSGKAITSNAVTVGFGFLALSVSEFLPLVTLSWMIWLTLNISALATMILLPALAVSLPNALKLRPADNKK
ncbi:MAG: RND family transporter [Deltaproteobacteria bacterium]|nr:RND family transporter [Deltaproteobacteria bacterium]